MYQTRARTHVCKYAILLSNIRALWCASLACFLSKPVTTFQLLWADWRFVVIFVPRNLSSVAYGIPITSTEVSHVPKAMALDLCAFRCAPGATS
jgi:hypothetical protein